MQRHDACGHAISCAPEAIPAWNRAITGFLSHSADTEVHLGAALQVSPGFALGWAMRGVLYLMKGRRELLPSAAEALANADRAIAEGQATGRERAYADALRDHLEGRLWAAADRLAAIAERYPGDVLALKCEHALRFVLGDRKGMLAGLRAAMPAVAQDHPHRGYAMGCEAFACEENGLYREAELLGRAGLETVADDVWGLHAVAHVYDMTAQNETGIEWLSGQSEAWAHCDNFGEHLWWHLGLFHLDLGAFDDVLALYDQRIRAVPSDDAHDIANAASMLTRLELEGLEIGDRWRELADLAATRVEDGSLVFADLHYLLALHGGRRDAEAKAMIDRLGRDAQRSDHDTHEVAGLSGLPTALGLAAFHAGRHDQAFETLRRTQPLLAQIGGSHAQRDVFSRLMIEAAIRAKRYRDAESELVARAERRGAEDGFTARRRAAISRLQLRRLAAE